MVVGPIVIEPKQWYRLCTQVANVLYMLGFDQLHGRMSNWEHWPDHAVLAAAALRANEIFGRFSFPDTDEASIPARYSAERRKRPASTSIDGASRTKLRRETSNIVVRDDKPVFECSELLVFADCTSTTTAM